MSTITNREGARRDGRPCGRLRRAVRHSRKEAEFLKNTASSSNAQAISRPARRSMTMPPCLRATARPSASHGVRADGRMLFEPLKEYAGRAGRIRRAHAARARATSHDPSRGHPTPRAPHTSPPSTSHHRATARPCGQVQHHVRIRRGCRRRSRCSTATSRSRRATTRRAARTRATSGPACARPRAAAADARGSAARHGPPAPRVATLRIARPRRASTGGPPPVI